MAKKKKAEAEAAVPEGPPPVTDKVGTKIGSYTDPDTGNQVDLVAGENGSVIETTTLMGSRKQTVTRHAALTGRHWRFIGK